MKGQKDKKEELAIQSTGSLRRRSLRQGEAILSLGEGGLIRRHPWVRLGKAHLCLGEGVRGLHLYERRRAGLEKSDFRAHF